MARRLSNEIKSRLGEELANWYRRYGRVAARRPYKSDQGEGGDAAAQPLFESHPWLSKLPVGAPSDLAFVDNNNPRCVEEAEKRSEELSNEPKHRLELRSGQQYQRKNQYIYEQFTKPAGM